MKPKLILIIILFSISQLNLSAQLHFLGFDQLQCNILENSPYTLVQTIGGKRAAPGFQILKNGIIVYIANDFAHDVPYWCHELKFINDSTGWMVETIFNTSYVKKTTDSGKTWKEIGVGIGEGYGRGYYGFYVVNLYTTFLITYLDYGFVISKASDFGSSRKRFLADTLDSPVVINDTMYGNPYCIEDTLSFKFLVNTDTLKVKINLRQLDLPVVSGTPKVIANKIDIFPNPASDYIKIHFEKSTGFPCDVYIQDMLGKVVMLKKINNPFEEDIFIGNLQNGVYLVKIQTGNSFLQSRFLKIKNPG